MQSESSDLKLVVQNFEAICAKTDHLAALFYEAFFAKHPEAKALFTNNPISQEQMLNETLISVIDHLEDLDWVQSNMEALGIRHHDYEVTDEMYDWWIDALIETLRNLSGDDWNAELERVWKEQLSVICGFARHAELPAP